MNIHKSGIILVLIFFAACTPRPQADTARIKMMVGTVTVEHNGVIRQAQLDEDLAAGDVVVCGSDGVAIVQMGTLADAEVQPGTRFLVGNLGSGIKELDLEKGNVWLRVNRKLDKDEQLLLRRSTTIAAVRGTKFYSFEFDGFHGTCECEGEIGISGKQGQSAVQQYDRVMVAKDGWFYILTEDEMRTVWGNVIDHRHSSIANSPLGPKFEPNPEAVARFKSIVMKHYAERDSVK